MSLGAARAPWWRPPELTPHLRIWLFIGMLLATTVTLIMTALPATSPSAPVTVPWLALAAAFGLTELAVVHTQRDRESIAFSLTDLALAFGFYVAEPLSLVLAQVVGGGVVFVCLRRQAPMKLLFNLGLYGLTPCLAVITFAAVLGGADAAGPRGWVAVLAAVLVANVVTELAIFYAVSTAEGRFDLRRLLETTALSIPFTQGSAAIALVGVRTLSHDPAALALLLVPALLVLASYRAFCRARRERSSMAFLHEVGIMLNRGGDLEPALADFLAASRSTFRAKIAELTMLGPDGDVTITRSTDDDEPLVLSSVADGAEHLQLLELTDSDSVVRTGSGAARGASLVDGYARTRGFKDVMVVAVRGDRLHGVLLVADRHGAVSTFDAAEATLFAALAHQLGRVLDNGHLEHSLRQLTELKEQLAYRASHDPLTGLANRSHFLEQTQQALDQAADHPEDAGPTVLYLDLDGFKEVNDTLGHAAGDSLLEVVASRLRSCLRDSDLVARLGGDEFAVLLDRADHDSDTVSTTAGRIRERIGAPVHLGGQLVTVGASIGIATWSAETSNVDDLVRRADTAMYSAKHAGGRQHVLYTSTPQTDAPPRYSAAELAAAIEADQIVVHYQPIVDLPTGGLVGAEALVRWQHPTDGLLSPASFIPLAERSGLITTLGRRVLEQACRDAHEWLERPGGSDLFVAVNLSAAQLADSSLVTDVATACGNARLDPTSLLLEITETTLMRDQQAAAATLANLKRLGVQLAVDDFGTGYSSLAYLRRFPVDMLKIAGEFTQGIDTDPEENIVTQAIIQLAETLGLRCVAEGIETPSQHRRLTIMNCALGQGYLFSHPVATAAMHQLLESQRLPVPSTAA